MPVLDDNFFHREKNTKFIPLGKISAECLLCCGIARADPWDGFQGSGPLELPSPPEIEICTFILAPWERDTTEILKDLGVYILL